MLQDENGSWAMRGPQAILDGEDHRIETVDGFDEGAIRTVSDHGDKRANIHAVVWNSKEDDPIHCSNKRRIGLTLRLRHRYQGLLDNQPS